MKEKKPAYVKNRKKTKNVDYISIALFLIALLAFFYFVYDYQQDRIQQSIPEEEKIISYSYNGHDFTKEAGIWYTQIEKNGVPYIIMTQYGPLEVENETISYNTNFFPRLTRAGEDIYITFDPREENKSDVAIAGVNFKQGLTIVYNVNVKPACTINDTGCPIVQTCNSTDKGVIEIIRDDDARGEYEGNCLKIYGKDQDLIKITNRILFEWYGIIQVDEAGQVYRT
ncbi:hypothetical protein C0585_06235 [Candidatus Woesearchaeota archaeon]|nr:MAG: hypothetical protein C0585_06235 [Candidatus Woesearchaeota archaeon]